MIEQILIKLTCVTVGLFLLVAGIRTFAYYLLVRMARSKVRSQYTKAEWKAALEKAQASKMELKDIMNYSQVEPYALRTKNLFHDLMKGSSLSREQILYFKKILNDRLGTYQTNYSRFTNDAHEIYAKLMSSHLSITDHQNFIRLLKTFEAQNDKVFVGSIKQNVR